MISFTGILAAYIALMALQSCNVNHFYDNHDSSNNHTIRAPNELVVGGGDITSQAKSSGDMCLSCVMSALCLLYLIWLIEIVFNHGLR